MVMTLQDRIEKDVLEFHKTYALEKQLAEMYPHLAGRFPTSATAPSTGNPFADDPYRIIQGNANDVLHELTAEGVVVHSVVTSPPYFAKRKYGNDGDELGRESDIDTFINNLVEIFSAVPLHPAGSIWINLGDKRSRTGGLQMIPERFALAMIVGGFTLVDLVVWAKVVDNEDGTTLGNCLPEPARHRLNGNGHEYLYRFIKKKRPAGAWTDTCAVRLPREHVEDVRYLPEELMSVNTSVVGRNAHNVWRVNMGQTRKRHWAVYPESLCERPIAMTCPMWVCKQSGAPSRRSIEMIEYDNGKSNEWVGKHQAPGDLALSGRNDTGRTYIPKYPKTTGWTLDPADCEPGIVLDPFCGTATTGAVALKLGRHFIGIDLYENYCQIAEARLDAVQSAMNVDPRLVAN